MSGVKFGKELQSIEEGTFLQCRSLDRIATPLKDGLFVACQHHDSASVVGCIVSLADITLDTIDQQGNTALHYACLGAKYETIALLLEKYDAVSASKWNAHKKLPIDLLWESDEVLDRESVEYTDSIFRLLKAYPETFTNIERDEQPAPAVCSAQSGIGKKRKFGHA